ncbi:hypothetical protein Neosp_010651 [[Neocosmospora] mangrovei]
MPPAPPPLPTRFPCWCRAVYSWGGESKRDLGFIEGDLIECLNAGDGSWWVGRLYRDRRTVGSFPSNFVELLPSEFRPTTKSVPSPASTTPSNAPTKSRTFRKPFEAYAKAPHYTSAKQPEVFKETPKPPKPRVRQDSGASFAPSTHEVERGPSPVPPPQGYHSRGPSPAPPSWIRSEGPIACSSPRLRSKSSISRSPSRLRSKSAISRSSSRISFTRTISCASPWIRPQGTLSCTITWLQLTSSVSKSNARLSLKRPFTCASSWLWRKRSLSCSSNAS